MRVGVLFWPRLLYLLLKPSPRLRMQLRDGREATTPPRCNGRSRLSTQPATACSNRLLGQRNRLHERSLRKLKSVGQTGWRLFEGDFRPKRPAQHRRSRLSAQPATAYNSKLLE